MTITLTETEAALNVIETKVGTEWLEKWVHEIKELEFRAAPTKSYQEFEDRIPPIAIVWCKARDELAFASITGNLKLNSLQLLAWEIGVNLAKCEQLPGFEEQVNQLKSRSTCSFRNAVYSLAVAAGYTGPEYKTVLGKPILVEHRGDQLQVMYEGGLELTPEDLHLQEFWHLLAVELGQRLAFSKEGRIVLITALEKPQAGDVKAIVKEIMSVLSSKTSPEELPSEFNLNLHSKYKIQLKAAAKDQLCVPPGYEFGQVMGSCAAALRQITLSDRRHAVIKACARASEFTNKKIPTMMYVDIPVGNADDVNILLDYCISQIKIETARFPNLSKVVLTAGLIKQSGRTAATRVYKRFNHGDSRTYPLL